MLSNFLALSGVRADEPSPPDKAAAVKRKAGRQSWASLFCGKKAWLSLSGYVTYQSCIAVVGPTLMTNEDRWRMSKFQVSKTHKTVCKYLPQKPSWLSSGSIDQDESNGRSTGKRLIIHFLSTTSMKEREREVAPKLTSVGNKTVSWWIKVERGKRLWDWWCSLLFHFGAPQR